MDYSNVGPLAPCIRATPSSTGEVLLNLTNYTPRPETIEVRFMTASPLWPAARYDGVVGYIEYEWLDFDMSNLSKGLFTTSALRNGDSGTAIYNLQGCLNLLGASLSLDSSFGTATENAVKAFQRSVGLTADGVVGSETKREIILALDVL